MIWKVLGIEKTKNTETIRNAYHDKLHSVNPEDDQEGFKELRRAYEKAIQYAEMPEEDDDSGNDESEIHKRKNDVDKWVDRINDVYGNVSMRRDVEHWKRLLNDPICDDLDTEIEAGEKLLVYLMSHSYLPQTIWKQIDKRFNYSGSIEHLKERFPENYLEYVVWQIKHPSFIDYDLFDGDMTDHVDDYINKLFEIKNAEEECDAARLDRLLKELSRFELHHPFAEVEEARFLLIKAGELPEFVTDNGDADADDKADDYRKQALQIMESLDFEFSANLYIHRMYAETLLENRKIDNAREIFNELLQKDETNYSARLGIAKCSILEKDLENAKEQLEDILEERVQDVDSLSLLDVVNLSLVDTYCKELEADMNKETCVKLGWCYYQQREFEKGIELLDRLGESNDYDYVNLRCRLYLANDEYEKAFPWAKKWLALIEDSEDDGSREMEKRKNRLSLAHFSIGVCIWEMEFKDDDSSEDTLNDAVAYINMAVDEEDNLLVKLSYMEQLARFYLAAKRYDECVDKCTEIIEKDSGFFPAYVHRQKANYELKNAKEVVDDYFACIEIYPEYAQPYLLAAEVFFAFDQYEDVEKVLETAKNANIESDGLRLYKVRLLHYKEFSKESLKKAYEEIEKLKKDIESRTEDNPSDIDNPEDVERELALIYWDMDETDMAIMVIDKYMDKKPDCISLLNLKVDILNRADRSDEALAICKGLYAKNQNAYNGTRLGVCYERTDNYDEAIHYYKEAYAMDSNYHVVVRRLMYLYSYLSDRKKDLSLCRTAINYATKYIELTNNAEGYVERGNLYIDLYELEKAVDDCQKAIELDPEAYYAYNNLGCALLKLRRVAEAIPPLLSALKLDEKKDHLPYLNLAEAYTVLGDYRRAIDEYKYMLDAFPQYTYVRKDIAKLYCKMGEYDKAIAYYTKELAVLERELNSDNFIKRNGGGGTERIDKENRQMQLYCDIAGVYRQKGDNSNAKLYYDKVIKRLNKKLKPRLSMKYITEIAEYYRDEGEIKEAVNYIKMAYSKFSAAERSTQAFDDLQFAAMTIFYEACDYPRAYREGLTCYNKFINKHGGLENTLDDARYRPSRLYHIGIIKLCMGDVEEAKKYISQIADCNLCVMCECSGCFEYYFGMGLIAESEGRKEDAVKLYEKAIELKGDYPCAKRHLNLCRQ